MAAEVSSPHKLSKAQHRMGPAPFASFEDLSDDFSSPEDRTCEPMPEIAEENEPRFPADHEIVSTSTSTVQTPTTPRIDVENPSSPSQNSGESTPERELFGTQTGTIAGGFLETAADVDLRSSAEELVIPDESKQGSRVTSRLCASSGRDRKVSWDAGDNRLTNIIHERKGSSSSVRSVDPIFFGAHNTRLSSFSSNVSGYSALSVASSSSRRSPSPHRMLLETSFCGPKRNIANDDDAFTGGSSLVPNTLTLGPASSKPTSPLNSPLSPGYMRKLMVKYVTEPRSRPSSPFELSPAPSPTPRDRQGSATLSVGRRETRSPSPHRITLETSFCGSKRSLVPDTDADDPERLRRERSGSFQQSASPRPLSPMPVRYTTEPRSRPASPCPPALSAYSPLSSRRESRSTTRSPSPHRTILETSFVGIKQSLPPVEPDCCAAAFNGVRTALEKSQEKLSIAPVTYHREPRSRPSSPMPIMSDEIEKSEPVCLKTFSSNGLGESKSSSEVLASASVSTESVTSHVTENGPSSKNVGTPRHLPKPVACPKAPQLFSAKSDSTQTLPTSSGNLGERLEAAGSVPAAYSTPSSPFPSRKMSADVSVRRNSVSADAVVENQRGNGSDTTQSESSEPKVSSVPTSTLEQDADPKKDKKEPKNRNVFTALFKRGNKKSDDKDTLRPGNVSRDPSPGRSVGDSGVSGDDLDDEDLENSGFNHQVLETTTEPEGVRDSDFKDVPSSESEREAIEKEVPEPEKLGLFTQDSIEEDLPYVPTTLPQERPIAPPVTPTRMRIAEVKTIPIGRPRCSVSINPCSLNDYVRMTKEPEPEVKIKLKLPRREDSTDDPKTKPTPSVKINLAETVEWESFAEKALRSPRLFRRIDSEQLADNSNSKIQDSSAEQSEVFANFANWINLETVPEPTKPPKKIQTPETTANNKKNSLKTVDEKPDEFTSSEDNGCSDDKKRKNSASSETALLREIDVEEDQDEEASVREEPEAPSSLADPSSRPSSSQSDLASDDGDNNEASLDAPLISRPSNLLSTSPFGMDLDVRSNRSSIAIPSDVPSPDELSISTQ